MFFNSILNPMVVLASWTFAIEGWLYATRIPAIFRLQREGKLKDADMGKITKETFNAAMPAEARRVSDNFTHLHEQPTVFYALLTYIHLAGHASTLQIRLAWTYVALRMVHSLIHCTFNIVKYRFSVFLCSSLTLLAMALLAVWSEMSKSS